jgi:CheY-like chemotaxis protein
VNAARIILIEDSQIVREPLARLLAMEGFDVTAAADGAEAMDALEAAGADLILLDVLMPRMHGVAFLEQLRAREPLRDIPVIGLTGISDTGRLNRLRELGVKSIVHKVRFTFEGLLEEIRHHLPEHAVR